MNHGFRARHFKLLQSLGGHYYDGTDARSRAAKAELGQAYVATEAWAQALRALRYPAGTVEIRKAVINQGHAFSPYTWAKIYPSPASPKQLAITVGIDAAGFIVKLDTVGNPPERTRYLDLRGPSNDDAPFAKRLSIHEGLAMTLEQLTEWSAAAIAEFEIGYDELALLIGLPSKLVLITDQRASSQAFAAWRAALMAASIRKGSLFWIPVGGMVMRPGGSAEDGDLQGMELGVDPAGRYWAVQINEPRIAGDFNSLSGIAMDAVGKRFLVRQGFLRPSPRKTPTIKGDEFIARTGLLPVNVGAEGLAARRRWFKVCELDVGAEQIVVQTSRFVDRCAEARASVAANEPVSAYLADDQFGAAERGGLITIRQRERQERLALRKHGTIWLALADVLGRSGLRVRKGRHPLGFEVDAEVDGKGIKPLLIEIKTGVSSGDIHTGVGQLHLYPRLLPRLSGHDKVLLLPRRPAPEVCAAAEACGIALHLFDLRGDDKDPEISFAPELLERCGIQP